MRSHTTLSYCRRCVENDGFNQPLELLLSGVCKPSEGKFGGGGEALPPPSRESIPPSKTKRLDSAGES